MEKRDIRRHCSSTQEIIRKSEKDRVSIEKNIYYKKSPRKYYVVFYYGVDPETKKPIKREKTYSSEREAIAARNAFEREKRADMVTKPTRDTLFTCIDNYIKAKEIAGREKATLAEYHKFEKHLHEYSLFEKKPVQTITERDVIDYLLYLDTIKKLAANTRRKHYDFLKSVLNKAVRDRIIPANPIAYLDAPRKTPSCAKAMPEELFKQVLYKAQGTNVEVLIILLAFGMRREEIAGLRWEHVNFKTNTIHICEVRTEVNGVVETKVPKTRSSNRYISMPQRFFDVLAKIKQRQKNHSMSIRNMNHLYVVGKADGSPYSPNYINDLMVAFEEKNGFPHYRLHDYRHTAATLLHDVGVPIYDVSKFLGHASIGITADLYTHQSDQTNAAAAKKLDEILGGSEPGKTDS